MPGKVRPVPEGFHTVNTYLIVPNSQQAMAFYEKAFGAESGMRMPGPDGESTMHAEMRLGDSTFMLSDENPHWGSKSPKSLGGTAASLHLYVEKVDEVFARATKAGCEVIFPVTDMFWGDRYCKLKDPYGHEWGIATHTEDLEPDEIGKRANAWFSQMGGDCGGAPKS